MSSPVLPSETLDAAAPVFLPGEAIRRPEPAITHGPLRTAVLRLALPAVGNALFQVLFNLTDTFWVGRLLGPEALAGVSAAGYSVWVILSLGQLLAVGLVAVAARRYGEGDPAAAARAAGTGLWLAAALGGAVGIAGLLTSDLVFQVMAVTGPVKDLGQAFLDVQLAGAFPVFAYLAVDAAFRASGDTRTPFFLLGGAVVVNMVLDPLMIAGLGPFPRLGVHGAALTTVFTWAGGLVVGLRILIRRGAVSPVLQWPVAGAITRIGLPTALSGVLFSLIYVVLVRVVRVFGTPALAAMGIGHKVEGINYTMIVGFAMAAGTVVGQNLGAGRPDRAREAGWLTVRLALVPTALIGALFVLVPGFFAGWFTTDPATIEAAAGYLRAVGVAQVAMTAEVILEAACSGAGYTLWPMFWVVSLSAIRLPLAAWAAARFGLDGIWWTLSATMLARGLALTALWRWAGWERARA